MFLASVQLRVVLTGVELSFTMKLLGHIRLSLPERMKRLSHINIRAFIFLKNSKTVCFVSSSWKPQTRPLSVFLSFLHPPTLQIYPFPLPFPFHHSLTSLEVRSRFFFDFYLISCLEIGLNCWKKWVTVLNVLVGFGWLCQNGY